MVSVPAREVPPAKANPKAQTPKGAYLGVTVLEGTKGVMVTEVVANTTADRAKLKVDDFILAIGDTKLKDLDEMTAALAKFKSGDAVTLKVLRGTEELELKGTFGKGFGGKGGKQDQNQMGGLKDVSEHDVSLVATGSALDRRRYRSRSGTSERFLSMSIATSCGRA